MENKIFNLSINPQAAIEFLKDWNKQGHKTIPFKVFIQFTTPRIQNKAEVIKKLSACAQLRPEWNISELNKRTGISRQTFYNWKEQGYLIFSLNKKLNLKETLKFWQDIDSYI